MLTESFSANTVQNVAVLEKNLTNAMGMRNVEWVNWSKYTFCLMSANDRIYAIIPPYSFGSKNCEFKSGTHITNQEITVISSTPGTDDYFRMDFHDTERPEYLNPTTKTA